MRAALLLLVVLLAPLGAGEPAIDARSKSGERDLVVLLADEGVDGTLLRLLSDAVPLAILPGFVVRDASPALEAALRDHPAVLRVERARALEFHTHDSLSLTRAERSPRGLAELAYTGRGVTVAVVDSGIDATHPDLQGRVKANIRLVDNRFLEVPGDVAGHGTHVAGIVAATGASGGHAGVAPEAELVGLDITDRFTTTSALLAYDWLFVNAERLDIRVVVNAWGRMPRETFDPEDSVARAIDRLVDQGVVVLFSSSNHGPRPSSLSFEAQHPRVVTVGATDDAALMMAYSARGPALYANGLAYVKPDVVAPGEAIVSARSLQSAPDLQRDVGALHRSLSGTSQAVPHVAGIVALMLEADARLTPRDIQAALHEAAIDLGAEGPDDVAGFGLVDARDSLRVALARGPDRGNVLVAGGIERREASARVAPAPPQSLLDLARGSAAVDAWEHAFPVKTGATGLAFEVSWSGAAAPLSATLAHSGREVATWSRVAQEEGRAVLRGQLDAPEAGAWTLQLRGAAPVALEVEALIDVTLPPNATRAAALDPRYHLPQESAGSTLPRSVHMFWVEARLFALAHPYAAPLVACACLALLGVAARAVRRLPRAPALAGTPDDDPTLK